MKLSLLTFIFASILSSTVFAGSSYETYRLGYTPENVMIKLQGVEAQVLYKQLVGPEVDEFVFPGFSERLGKDMKCMKEGRTYICEILINTNGKAQAPSNG